MLFTTTKSSIMIRNIFILLFYFYLFRPTNAFNCFADTSRDTIVTAGKHYKAKWFKRLMLGTHYRAAWYTPVRVRLLDIDTVKGGLSPIKQGGSRQTTNLRLTDKEGRQYVIRSVDKKPSRALPEDFQNTLIADIVQDQTSAGHPYAALTIPALSKAAGIYHTNPELFFVPYDSSLGKFTHTFANMMVFLEERPDEDMSHLASSGHSQNVIGTRKLFEHLYNHPHRRVDEKLFLKTRLFDMWIGDWGRHEDQWRWAEFKTEEDTLYRPIPRDRDHAFFKFDGILPRMSRQKGALPQLAHFDHKIKNVYGLNRSATSLDRSILTSLYEQDWLEIAEELQICMTDSVIEQAIRKFPSPIYAIHGKEIEKKLKSRRKYIPKAAKRYYKEIYKNVDIVGSQQNETFIIQRTNPAQTEIIVFNTHTHDTIHKRVYHKQITKEIRLYGLEGNDSFIFYGKARQGMRVRAIGGDGNDLFKDYSAIKGRSKKNLLYDTRSGTSLIKSKETRDLRSDAREDSIHLFKRNSPDYNFTAIIPSAEYNPDDGIFMGIGTLRKTFGFRKYPYSSLQQARLHYATQTSAISFRYTGNFKQCLGKWNLKLEGRLFGPRFAYNYFGFGNNTLQKDTSISYYRVRAFRVVIEPLLYRKWNKYIEVGWGPHYEFVDIEKTDGRYISEPGSVSDPSDFEGNHYAGLKSYFKISSLDNVLNPKKGIEWYTEAGIYDQFGNKDFYANLNANFSFFYTPPLPFRVTFATRIGGATNLGDFIFYRGNALGGTTNLRGYRRSRFIGRSSAYHNTELRFYISKVNFYLFPGKIGVLAFYDYGRVWADHEKSSIWHTGYGPGLFLQVYDRFIFSGTCGFSKNTQYINAQVGFLF